MYCPRIGQWRIFLSVHIIFKPSKFVKIKSLSIAISILATFLLYPTGSAGAAPMPALNRETNQTYIETNATQASGIASSAAHSSLINSEQIAQQHREFNSMSTAQVVSNRVKTNLEPEANVNILNNLKTTLAELRNIARHKKRPSARRALCRGCKVQK